MWENLFRLARNCFLPPPAEESPADGQLQQTAQPSACPFSAGLGGGITCDHMVPAPPGQGEHPGLCLPSEQPRLCSQSPAKGAGIRPFPHPSALCHFICHVWLIQAFPGIFPKACLSSAGLGEPLKPNSDISWPTALLAREKRPSGSSKRSLLSPRRGKSLFCTARPSRWERFCLESPWCSHVKMLQHHQQHLLP